MGSEMALAPLRNHEDPTHIPTALETASSHQHSQQSIQSLQPKTHNQLSQTRKSASSRDRHTKVNGRGRRALVSSAHQAHPNQPHQPHQQPSIRLDLCQPAGLDYTEYRQHMPFTSLLLHPAENEEEDGQQEEALCLGDG
ncbi:uncharacterized protein LOC110768085 [Prunus avium]|uniref:Uncharacterized protein LOC110768085 n=1 Tax=Prunus avium TaxID=42229 RepID=A0A6P5TK85_PRUAV|nr:uncharacterized protein LOC110768085 [Prunus avium]